MRIKSFFVDTLEAGIAEARRQLGPDAVLITSRPAADEARRLGSLEVVFGLDEEPAGSAPSASPAGDRSDALAAELTALRRQLDTMRQELGSAPSWMPQAAPTPRLMAWLTGHGMDLAVARQLAVCVEQQILAGVGGASGHPSLEQMQYACQHLIGEQLKVDPAVGRVCALVGPPGSGKTATLAKLAIRFGVAAGRQILIVSTDADRVGASEQLRVYSAIMGAPFEALQSVAELPALLRNAASKDMVLIDVPGLTHRELPDYADLARMLAGCGADVHLVLPATAQPGYLARTAIDYKTFNVSKLLFTRLDEADSLGPVLALAMRTSLPVSFVCDGQGIPEDLHDAGQDRLLQCLDPRLSPIRIAA